jgi:uncharacterized protein (TIGR02118 family)
MVKLIALLVKRDELGELEFHEHWRYTHGPLAAKITTMRRYCQCHLVPCPPEDLPIAREYGGTAEVWWDDLAAAQRLATDPEYTENAEPDEPNFIDMERMVFMTVREQPVLQGPPLRKDSNGIKVIQLVTRVDGLDPDSFRRQWEAQDDSEESGQLRMTRHTRSCCIPEAYGEKPPAFDAAREMWWPDEWAFAAGRNNAPEAWGRLTGAPMIDPDRSPFLVTVENRVVWEQ